MDKFHIKKENKKLKLRNDLKVDWRKVVIVQGQ